MILLRAIFGVAPALNYALALSSLGFRDYIIGSIIGMARALGESAPLLMIGMAAPITIAAILLDVAL